MKTEKQIIKRLKRLEEALAKMRTENREVDEDGYFENEWLYITEINVIHWILGIKRIKVKTVTCNRYKRVRFATSKEYFVTKSDHPKHPVGSYMSNEDVRKAILECYVMKDLTLEPVEIHDIKGDEVTVTKI